MSAGTTRRGLITGAVGLGAVASLGAAAVAATAATSTDVQALSGALELERASVIGYTQVLASSVLTASARAQLEVLKAQDLEHVAKLEQTIARLGAPLPQGPASVAAVELLLGRHQIQLSLTNLPTQHYCLRLLIDIESLTEGAYFKAIPELTDPSLVKVSLELMGSNSQHWTVLSGIQHDGNVGLSVPYPFVEGSP